MLRGLADLHVHLYGAITADRFLEHVRGRTVDWSSYQRGYEDAFGTPCPLGQILARLDAGDESARADWRRLFEFGPRDAGSFSRFQAKFDLLLAGSHFRNPSGSPAGVEAVRSELSFFVRGAQDEQARQGITYAEHRINLAPDHPAAVTRASSEALLESLSRDPRSTSRLALGLPRSDPWPMWELAQKLARSPAGATLTAVDYCHFEEGHPPKRQAELFKSVRAFNKLYPERALAILYHVGESYADKSLESAVRWVHEAAELGAHRLGHALALAVEPDAYGEHVRAEPVSERIDQIEYELIHHDGLTAHGIALDRGGLERERAQLQGRSPDAPVEHRYDARRLVELRSRQDYAMARVRESGAVVEVCPTSNVRIAGLRDPTHHPVRRFLEAGLRVVVGSDDPGLLGTTLCQELDWVAQYAGLDESGVDRLVEASWGARSELLSGRTKRPDRS